MVNLGQAIATVRSNLLGSINERRRRKANLIPGSKPEFYQSAVFNQRGQEILNRLIYGENSSPGLSRAQGEQLAKAIFNGIKPDQDATESLQEARLTEQELGALQLGGRALEKWLDLIPTSLDDVQSY